MHHAPIQTATATRLRNTARLDRLAGCTPLAVAMINARVGVVEALKRHRSAQARARSSFPVGVKPEASRARVRQAIRVLRSAEQAVEAKYGSALKAVA